MLRMKWKLFKIQMNVSFPRRRESIRIDSRLRGNDTKVTMLSLIPWAIASFFAFFQFLGQSMAGIMSTVWMQDFHLDKIALSNLSAAFFYTYALCKSPAEFY